MIPTAIMEKNQHHYDGLTDIRTGSDLLSSSCGDDSSMNFEADSNQTLHSYANLQQKPVNHNATIQRAKLSSKDKSFQKTITEELDSEMENRRPNLMPVSEFDEDRYDEEKLRQADKKHKEVAFMTSFLEKDIAYTLKDVESSQNENAGKAGNATAEVEEHAANLNKKLDGMMANIIKLTNFGAIPAEDKKKSK